MSRSVLLALRVLLALLFGGALATQLTSGVIAGTVPSAGPATVLTILIIVGALSAEVVLLSVWMLVGMVATERIFDERGQADRWVSAAICALFAGAAAGLAGLGYFLLVQALSAAPWAVPLIVLTGAAAGAGAALALVVVVMRRLLHTAISLRSELDEVV